MKSIVRRDNGDDWKEYVRKLAGPVHHADESDTQTLAQTLAMAQANLIPVGSDEEIRDAVADKGYHSNETMTWCQSLGIRTHIPERESRYGRRWTDKPSEEKSAVYGHRHQVRGKRGKALGRLRSEYTERSSAHTRETGGARRSRLRGLINVARHYLMYVAGRNLGVVMRALFGIATPKSLQTEGEASACAFFAWLAMVPTGLGRLYGILVIYLAQGPARPASTPAACPA
jgi:transposase